MVIEFEPISAIMGIISGMVAFIKRGKRTNNKLCAEPCPPVQSILDKGTERMDELKEIAQEQMKVTQNTGKLVLAIARETKLISPAIEEQLGALLK